MYERTAVQTHVHTYIHTYVHTYIHRRSVTYERTIDTSERTNVRTLTTKLISVHPARAVMRPMPTDVAA